MRIVGTFTIREVLDEIVAIPAGDALSRFSGIISLNPVGKFIFECLATEQTEESLLAAVLAEYEVDEATAAQDLKEILAVLREHGLLVE